MTGHNCLIKSPHFLVQPEVWALPLCRCIDRRGANVLVASGQAPVRSAGSLSRSTPAGLQHAKPYPTAKLSRQDGPSKSMLTAVYMIYVCIIKHGSSSCATSVCIPWKPACSVPRQLMIMYTKHEERLHFLRTLLHLSSIMSAVGQDFAIWPSSCSWFKQMLL